MIIHIQYLIALAVSCTCINAFASHSLELRFSRSRIGTLHTHSIATALYDKYTDKEDDIDWRAFRAQLVQSENSSSTNAEKSSHWAYDSGEYVEAGSIVISIPSSNPTCDDIDALTNQCYRKSIVLVLDVTNDYIQGIILNRPTNIRVGEGLKFMMHEESNDADVNSCLATISVDEWKVWFGGETLGPYSDSPHVMCLHSIQTELALDVSEIVVPGILVCAMIYVSAIDHDFMTFYSRILITQFMDIR